MFYVMQGRGKRATWLFLADERFNVIRGFSKGGMASVRRYLERQNPGAQIVCGAVEGRGTARRRAVHVIREV
jgi:hypothetical protein